MTCRGRGNEGNSEALLVIYVILVEVLSQMVSLLDCCIFVMLNGTNTMLFFLLNSQFARYRTGQFSLKNCLLYCTVLLTIQLHFCQKPFATTFRKIFKQKIKSAISSLFQILFFKPYLRQLQFIDKVYFLLAIQIMICEYLRIVYNVANAQWVIQYDM